MPGYELRLIGDNGQEVADGELGNLHVSGPTSAVMYWNQREKSRDTFQGRWTVTGDKYYVDEDGYYIYGGRSDDMMKVGASMYRPSRLEGSLIAHDAVLKPLWSVIRMPTTRSSRRPSSFLTKALRPRKNLLKS